MSETGIVFDISHYMIEDGPGIRTNVFVKGCPLRCKWCSNAFGLEQGFELACKRDKCIGCGACMAVCKKQAVSIKEGKAGQDFAVCRSCLNGADSYACSESRFAGIRNRKKTAAEEPGKAPCVPVCPAGAREVIGREMTTDEVIEEVLKDQIFYRRGGGGMTVSGGEVLWQAPFVIELLKDAEAHYLSNAIETSGCGRWEDLRQMIDHADVLFMDLKAADAQLHRQLTGVENDLILENIRKAAAYCKEKGTVFVLRFPAVPGLNDGEDNLRKIAAFAKELDVELNVLPYHNLGAEKYRRIGKQYGTAGITAFTKEQLAELTESLRAAGARVSLGGYGVESY